MPSLTVVYDACVLYPAPLRDLLMHLTMSHMYRGCWTDLIHDEWINNLLIKRPDLNAQQLNRTRQLMNSCTQDSLITGFEKLIPLIKLPDEDDRHVVAAAIHVGANLIITFNLKDFPDKSIISYNLKAQHPDDFISDLFDIYPSIILKSMANHRHSLRSPKKTVDEYLNILLMQGLTQLVALVRPWHDIL